MQVLFKTESCHLNMRSKKKKKIFGIDLLENTPRESTPEKMKTSSREYYI